MKLATFQIELSHIASWNQVNLKGAIFSQHYLCTASIDGTVNCKMEPKANIFSKETLKLGKLLKDCLRVASSIVFPAVMVSVAFTGGK